MLPKDKSICFDAAARFWASAGSSVAGVGADDGWPCAAGAGGGKGVAADVVVAGAPGEPTAAPVLLWMGMLAPFAPAPFGRGGALEASWSGPASFGFLLQNAILSPLQ